MACCSLMVPWRNLLWRWSCDTANSRSVIIETSLKKNLGTICCPNLQVRRHSSVVTAPAFSNQGWWVKFSLGLDFYFSVPWKATLSKYSVPLPKATLRSSTGHETYLPSSTCLFSCGAVFSLSCLHLQAKASPSHRHCQRTRWPIAAQNHRMSCVLTPHGASDPLWAAVWTSSLQPLSSLSVGPQWKQWFSCFRQFL